MGCFLFHDYKWDEPTERPAIRLDGEVIQVPSQQGICQRPDCGKAKLRRL